MTDFKKDSDTTSSTTKKSPGTMFPRTDAVLRVAGRLSVRLSVT